MAGFFKRIVDKISGYPDDAEFDYDNDYDYDDVPANQYESEPQGQRRQEQYASPAYSQEPVMQYTSDLRGASAPKVVPIKSVASGEQQLIILQPNNIQSAQRVCDHLRAGHTVICNIENVDAKIAQRVIDFISGSTYAMDGNVKPIDARAHSFVAVPRSVSLIDKEIAPQETNEYPEQYRMAR